MSAGERVTKMEYRIGWGIEEVSKKMREIRERM